MASVAVDLSEAVESTPKADPEMNDSAENDYLWLDTIDNDDSFMPLEVNGSRAGKSLDFGNGGFTGSLSAWHELLQLTAPDRRCGLVFVRGEFPDSADSMLARAQRRNQKGTFGLGIGVPKESTWVLEQTTARGMINMRWPYTRLSWIRQDERLGSVHFASYSVCSFVMDGVLWQVSRVTPVQLTSLSRTPSVANNGGICDMDGLHLGDSPSEVKYIVDVGGCIRFGCPNSAARNFDSHERADTTQKFPPKDHKIPPGPDSHERADTTQQSSSKGYKIYPEPESHEGENTTQKSSPRKSSYVISCESTQHEKRLEIRLWVDGKPTAMTLTDSGEVKAHGHHQQRRTPNIITLNATKELCFSEAKATVIVASFTLVDSGQTPETGESEVIDDEKARRYLGVADDASLVAPCRIWTSLCGPDSVAQVADVDAMGRAVESVLGVASLPVRDKDGNSMGTALLKNIVTPQVVDLESTFWQIRLLVKTVKLLGKIEPQPLAQATSSNTPPDARKERQRQYREAVIHCLREACRWISHFASRLTKGGLLRNPRLGILASDVTEDSMTRCDFTPAPDMRTNSQGETEHLACQWTRTREQKYYCAMALWYVLKELPAEVFGFNGDKVNGVSPDDTKAVKTDACPAPAAHTSILWESVKPLSLIRSRDNSGLMAIGEPANCMVRWYHSFCVEQILQRLESEDAAKFQKLEIDRAALALDADKWQKRAEKAMRLFYQGRLSGRLLGHEPANLARVGVEMGTGLKALTAPAAVRGCGRGGVTCLQMAQDLVRQRPATTKPNAGRASVLRWDPSPTHRKIRSAAPRPAPWELSCLAQHLPLNLWTAAEVATIPPGSAGHREALERDRERASDAVREFMLSDYAFAASWDASKSTVVGMWWDFATSCVVAARLVDDELDAAEAAAAIDDTTIAAAGTTSSTAAASSSVTDANPMADRQTRSVVAPSHPPSCPASRMGSRAGVETARDTSGLTIQLPVDSTADWSYVLAAIQAAAFVPRSIDGESDGRFDWKLSRPPELYHSESGVQSLEDTPSVYTIVRQGQSEEGRRSHDTQTPANNGDSRYTSSVHSTVKQGQSKESRRSHDMQTPANNGNSRYTPSVSNTVRQEQSKADRRSHDGQTPANNGDPRRDINLCYNVSNYIKHHALPDLDWTLDSIHKRIPASKLRHLSCFDLVLMNDVNDLPELSDPIINGRANRAFWSNWVNGDKKTRSGVHEAFTTHPGLMDLYLIGKARDYPGIEDSELTDAQKELLYKGNDSQDIRVKLLDDYQESCFDVLNDSLVDQGVKYRILFSKALTPETLQALVYVWHPDALNTFDDYLDEAARFFDVKIESVPGAEDMWATSITLMFWRLLSDEDRKVRDLERADEGGHASSEGGATCRDKSNGTDGTIPLRRTEEDREFPPPKMLGRGRRRWWRIGGGGSAHKKVRSSGPGSHMHEIAISMGITGDYSGRGWTCSIICELFSEEEMTGHVREAARVMQMFIHQQYSGRSLVFLMLLGHICNQLAQECSRFVEELKDIVPSRPKRFLDRWEWEYSALDVGEMRQIVWEVDILQDFDEKLVEGRKMIEQARDTTKATLKKRGGKIRDKAMKLEEQRICDEFERRYVRLDNEHTSIKRRLEQGKQLLGTINSVSSVLSVEQNKNISMLTWLTILYLPPTFITAMFQMGHGIVPETAGWATFIWTLGVLFGLTVALALALRSIIEKLRATWKATKGSLAVLIKKAGESVQGLWNTTKASTPPPHARQVQDEETASYTSGRESHVTSGVAQVARRRGS